MSVLVVFLLFFGVLGFLWGLIYEIFFRPKATFEIPYYNYEERQRWLEAERNERKAFPTSE